MSNELTMPERAEQSLAFAETRDKLIALASDSARIKAITNKAGYDECHSARMALKAARIEVTARGKSAREDAVALQKAVLAAEKQLVSLIEPEEARLKELQDAVDQAKAREKEAKEAAERERVAELHRRFEAIRSLPLRAAGRDVAAINELISEAEGIDPAGFPEDMTAAAGFERKLAIAGIKAARDERIAADKERERVAAELAELETLRAKQAEMQAEADRLADAERERAAAEARRIEDQARAEREAVETAQRKAREDERARIDAERTEQRRKEDEQREAEIAKLAQQQAEAAAAFKAARDAEIANASLFAAACEAVTFLRDKGFGSDLVTQKLAAAINREPQAKAA